MTSLFSVVMYRGDDTQVLKITKVVTTMVTKRPCIPVQGVVTTIPAVLAPATAVLIPFASVYYKKWAFTSVNYKLVKKSTTISGLGQAIKLNF